MKEWATAKDKEDRVIKAAVESHCGSNLITRLNIAVINNSDEEMRFTKGVCDTAYVLSSREFKFDTVVEGQKIHVPAIDITDANMEAVFSAGEISRWQKANGKPVHLHVLISPKESKFGVALVGVK